MSSAAATIVPMSMAEIEREFEEDRKRALKEKHTIAGEMPEKTAENMLKWYEWAADYIEACALVEAMDPQSRPTAMVDIIRDLYGIGFGNKTS